MIKVDTTGYLVNMNFTFNDNEDRIGEEIRMRSNYWGEAATNEMNAGGNPKDITQLFDNFDDDNDRTQINYSSWQGSTGGGAGYSGSIVFVDSLGTPIERYQGNHESIYVEVYDEDLSGSLDVLLSSDSDSLGETVTLQEIEDHLFNGSLMSRYKMEF